MSRIAHSLETLADQQTYDLVVLGTGAGGMAAALFGAISGAKVLLVESSAYVGGTSALSGGTTWVPLSDFKTSQQEDSYEKVSEFLDNAVGQLSPAGHRDAFLNAGAQAIRTLVNHTDVDFRLCPFHPDYMADLEGATESGRALEPLPFITRHLKEDLALLRPPIPEFTVLGGMMVNRFDINHLLARFQSLSSFIYSGQLVMRYAIDKLRFGQTARSVMGHALIARMLSSIKQQPNITLVMNTQTEAIASLSHGEHQISLNQKGIKRQVIAAKGVVFASGGFSHHPDKRRSFYPSTVSELSPAAEGNQGKAQTLAESLGAVYGEEYDQAAFWAPCSRRKRADGSMAMFPHFVFDRSKPGTLCVNSEGLRFVNESLSYHEFGKAMHQQTGPAYIVADHAAIQKYGLGIVRLGGDNLAPYLKDGYLIKGNTLAELAHKLKVPAANLETSVADINQAAASGVDSTFGRGSNVYQRANGDPSHSPNPTLGTLSQEPF